MHHQYLIFAFFLMIGCHASNTPDTPEGISSSDSLIKTGSIERIVVVDGALYSPSSRPITIQRIRWYWDYNISWAADEGSPVKEGDPIIRLDQSAIQKDLTEKETNLEEAKLTLQEESIRAKDDLADAKSAVTMAEFELKKEKLLLTNSDAVSEAEKQRQRIKIATAEASLRRAREKVAATKERTDRRIEMQALKVKQAEDEVNEMKSGLDKTELKAPQDGVVIFPLYSTSGGWQKAKPGGAAQVNAQVAEIANQHDLVARLYIPEVDAEGITVQTPGEITLSIAPGQVFSGHVKSVSSVPTTAAEREGSKSTKPSDNVRQFEVLLTVENLPKEAMPGMTVRAILTPIRKENVILVPTTALTSEARISNSSLQLMRNTSAGQVDQAYVLARGKRDSKFSWRPVKLGVQSLSQAEVIEGLAEGDTVKVFAW